MDHLEQVDKAPKDFEVEIYGPVEKYNEVISRQRVRIFYKGLNRNNTYISDEFAEKLIQTLSYAPVKGIYLKDDEDFSNHGEHSAQGKAYGVVPEQTNFAWEAHLDKDGVARVYACCDVYLWTGIYEEAKEIAGKAQSMELFEPSIRGHWDYVDGVRAFVFEEAIFLGLQALGAYAEPCFEGAAFFSLYSELKEMAAEVKKIFALAQPKEELELEQNLVDGGVKAMEYKFKLSDPEMYQKVFNALNPITDNSQEINYSLFKVKDDSILAYKLDTSEFMKINYMETEGNIVIGDSEILYFCILDKNEIKDVFELEEEADFNLFEEIKSLKSSNIQMREKVVADADEFKKMKGRCEELEEKEKEFELQLSELSEYKNSKENETKVAILEKYSKLISDEELITKFTENLSNYGVVELEKELSFALVQNTPTLFSIQTETLVPTDLDNDMSMSAADRIIKRYKDSKNGGE